MSSANGLLLRRESAAEWIVVEGLVAERLHFGAAFEKLIVTGKSYQLKHLTAAPTSLPIVRSDVGGSERRSGFK